MNYCLFKLSFSAPLHIGDSSSARSLETQTLSLCADTVFSAICNTAPECAKDFVKKAHDGELLLSDAFPYNGDVLYIPKPYITSSAAAAEQQQNDENSSVKKKKMKKLKYIPVSMLSVFFGSVEGKNDFDPSEIDNNFGNENITTRAAVRGREETLPYSVASFSFKPSCGLYFIVGYKEKDDVDKLQKILNVLGLGGIGGKVSSGYGKFSITGKIELTNTENQTTDAGCLAKMLSVTDGKKVTDSKSILLTAALPRNDEIESALEGASYNLIRRGGFAFSDKMKKLVKKDTQFFFAAGSVFENRFTGAVYSVLENSEHPVYRYSKPIFLGVNQHG